jgi:hypothetical protein
LSANLAWQTAWLQRLEERIRGLIGREHELAQSGLGLAGAALALGLAYASIGFSSLVILAAEAAAVALITVVAIAVLPAGGYRHNGSAPHRSARTESRCRCWHWA